MNYTDRHYLNLHQHQLHLYFFLQVSADCNKMYESSSHIITLTNCSYSSLTVFSFWFWTTLACCRIFCCCLNRFYREENTMNVSFRNKKHFSPSNKAYYDSLYYELTITLLISTKNIHVIFHILISYLVFLQLLIWSQGGFPLKAPQEVTEHQTCGSI